MLPSRAYSGPSVRVAPAIDARPPLIVAVDPHDVDRFPSASYARTAARTTTEAVRLIERWRPKLIAVDWETPEFDAATICAAAQQSMPVGILAVIGAPTTAPVAIRAGCNALLLKPFSLNLAAARLGRLCREMPAAAAASRLGATLQSWGTNRAWPDMHCPTCSEPNAVCFEYSSHRRSWYACLKCDHAWLGPRRE